jgi:hypothetical protein
MCGEAIFGSVENSSFKPQQQREQEPTHAKVKQGIDYRSYPQRDSVRTSADNGAADNPRQDKNQ